MRTDTIKFLTLGETTRLLAIDVCRRAIKAIYAHTGKAAVVWVDDDSDPGFDKGPS